MKKLFVIGATGFIGRNLADYFSKISKVFAGTYLSSHWRLNDLRKNDSITTCFCDITERDSVLRNIEQIEPDFIINSSIYGNYGNEKEPEKTFSVNLFGLINLIASVKQLKSKAKIIQLSTILESSKEFLSNYLISKAAATKYCQKEREIEGIPVIVLRLPSIYGRYEDRKRLIPNLLRFAIFRRSFPPLVKEDVRRDFLFVDDLCRCCELVFQAFSTFESVLDLSSGESTSIGEVASLVKEVYKLDNEPVFDLMPERRWMESVIDEKNLHFDSRLEFPKTSLRQGLVETGDWILNYGKQYSEFR